MWKKIARKYVVEPLMDKLEEKGVFDRLQKTDLKDAGLTYLALQDHVAEARENGASKLFAGWHKVSFPAAEQELNERKTVFYGRMNELVERKYPALQGDALELETLKQGEIFLLALALQPKAKAGREFLVNYAREHPEFEKDQQALATQEEISWSSRRSNGLRESSARR